MNEYIKALICVVMVTVIIVCGYYIYRAATLPPSWICKDGYLWERQTNSENDRVYVRHNRYCVEGE